MRTEASAIDPWLLPAHEGLPSKQPPDGDWLFRRVLPPRPAIRAELVARGFAFRDAPRRTSLAAILARAALLLSPVRSLEAAIEAAVHSIVLLRARPAFDISHSEPRWPSTIFISVPAKPSEVSALRAAESIIHEAMHVRLTRAERAAALVADMSATMTSPWREEARSLQGVLHGLYVFRCIAAFYAKPALIARLEPAGRRYVDKRRAEIACEVAGIDYRQLAAGLTPRGRGLVDELEE